MTTHGYNERVNSYKSASSGRPFVSFVNFQGVSPRFNPVAEVPFLGGWSFTPGINGTTFQFQALPYRTGRPIVSSSIDNELGEPNGEGVDCYSRHGTFKELLNIEIFLRVGDCMPLLRPDMFGRDELKKDGMVALLWAEFTDPVNGQDTVKFLQFPFFHGGHCDFSGGANEFTNELSTISVSVFFGREDE